jgi:hypothetical protein
VRLTSTRYPPIAVHASTSRRVGVGREIGEGK